MKFTLALLFAAFLAGISVCSAAGKDQKSEKKILPAKAAVENEDSSSTNASPIEKPKNGGENPVPERSPELQSQIALMENIKIKAAAVHPANLISAILKTPEDRLVDALPSLLQSTEILEGTSLGAFLQNLESVVADSNPYLWQSVIESYPDFVGSITEVGGTLAALANTESEVLTVFNEEEMGLTNLFPIADVDAPLSESGGESETEIEKIVDNVGHAAADLKKAEKEAGIKTRYY